MEIKIVVTDDDPISLKTARLMLGESGIKVSCLRSGNDLIRFLDKNEPDLILLDVLMPDMDGFETFEAIKNQAAKTGRPLPPVIFLTGENDLIAEQRGLKIGASDYVHKPFDKEILLSRIKNTVENRKKIETLREEATLDRLTGFFNKTSGTEKISALCSSQSGSLIIFDLDCFKLVNDIYGHDMGDQVLQAFAEIMRSNLRSEDIVARIGGDEFLGFINGITQQVAISSISQKLNDQLVKKCEELMGEEFDIPIGISSGAVFVPEYGIVFDKLFAHADNALYRVKQNGKHGCAVHDPTVVESSDDDNLETEIARITQLVEERGIQKGAMLLGPDAFAFTYRFIIRFIRRYKGCAIKLIISLDTKKEGYALTDAVSDFGEILRSTLRISDIIMKNRTNKYFLLLPEMSESDVPMVTGRILDEWEKSIYHDKVDIRFASEFISFQENK